MEELSTQSFMAHESWTWDPWSPRLATEAGCAAVALGLQQPRLADTPIVPWWRKAGNVFSLVSASAALLTVYDIHAIVHAVLASRHRYPEEMWAMVCDRPPTWRVIGSAPDVCQ